MKYNTFERMKTPTDAQIAAGDRAQYEAHALADHVRPAMTVAQLNDILRREAPEGRKLPLFPDKFSPEEQERRYARSRKVRLAFTKFLGDQSFSDHPATNLRYPETFMMKVGSTPEVRQFNEDVAHTLAHWEEDPKKYIGLYHKMLTEFDRKDIDGIALADLSDEQLADRAEELLRLGSFIMQFSNFRNDIRTAGFHPVDDETRRLYDECLAVMEKYESRTDLFTTLTNRLGAIDSPYYALLDYTDPDTIVLMNYLQENEAENVYVDIEEDVSEAESSLFDDFAASGQNVASGIYNGEAKEAARALAALGAAQEDLRWSVTGGNADLREQPFTEKAVSDYLTSHPGAEITVFDPADRAERSLTLRADGKGSLQKALIFEEDLPPRVPSAPREPLTKPKGLGFFNNLRHLFSSNYMRAEFDRYARDVAAYDAEAGYRREYPALKAKYDGEMREHELRLKLFRATHPGYFEAAPGELCSGQERRSMMDLLDNTDMWRTLECMYGANRKRRADFLQDRVYNEETWEAMSKSVFDLDSLHPAGLTLTERDFSAAAMMTALWEPMLSRRGEYLDSMVFDDMFTANGAPRMGMSDLIPAVIEPSRRFLADCLAHFDEALPDTEPPATGREKLAEALAAGLTEASKRLVGKDWGYANENKQSMLADSVAHTLAFADRLGLADAMRAHGLTDETRENIRIASSLSQVIKDAQHARCDLIRANAGEKGLTSDERRACVDKVALAAALNAEGVWHKAHNVQDINMELPVKAPGESEAAFQQRLYEFSMQAMGHLDQGEGVLSSFSERFRDLANGGTRLQKLSEALVPNDERAGIASGTNYDIYQQLVTLDRGIEGRMKTFMQAHPDGVLPEPAPAPEHIPADEVDRLVEKVYADAPGRVIPEGFGAALETLRKRADAAAGRLHEKCAEQPEPFPGGDDVREILAYRTVKTAIEQGTLTDRKLALLSAPDGAQNFIELVHAAPLVSYAADRPHQSEFFSDNLLTDAVLGDLAEQLDAHLTQSIANAPVAGQNGPVAAQQQPVAEQQQPVNEQQPPVIGAPHSELTGGDWVML